ncbi:MAG: quinol dehydrogenase ferredoxin subunit NapH [Ectothiorhodospiraceae bacterium]|nr:quinol dehydrogenase ferredoxin subunit NapH [Ectothiorhodospiraceae bacterium]
MSRARVPGVEATATKGWLRAHRFLVLRRLSQLLVVALFMTAPLLGVAVLDGSLAASRILGVVPLSDPLVLAQTLAAGHWPASTALVGAAIVLGFYALLGGRAYCAWVCPVNVATDAAAWLHARLGLPPGWQPPRATRRWLVVVALVLSALTGTVVWELVNPVTLVHRGLVFGIGLTWAVVAAVFLFDLLVSRHGWCGRLCPVGATYAAVGQRALVRIRADARAACDDCLDCVAVCPEPQVIMPVLKGEARGVPPVIVDADCTACGRCVDVCAKHVFHLGTRLVPRAPADRTRAANTVPRGTHRDAGGIRP